MRSFDDLDKNILTELLQDSSVSVPVLAEKLNSNQSVLYSRIRRMRDAGVIKKFTVLVDDSVLGVGVKATVGISRSPKVKEKIHSRLVAAKEVEEIFEVTGRFDMLVRIKAENLEELHRIVTDKIGKIDGIYGTETFVDLQKTEKNTVYG